MSYRDEDGEDEREKTYELPEVRVDEPGHCSICGKDGQRYGCFRCGRPVCYNQDDYLSDSSCGGWILDTWHNDHPEGNEFYCAMCLHAGLLGETLEVGGITFAYSDHKTLFLTVDGVRRELTHDETCNLVAFLYDRQGELFNGKRGGEPPVQVVTERVESSGLDDILGDLDELPF